MTVGAKDRAKGAVLEPARIELLIARRHSLRIVQRMIAADVRGPISETRQREVEACGNLAAQRPPTAVHIAGPDRGANPLLAHECRAREKKDALLRVGLPPVIRDAVCVLQRKDVGVLQAAANVELLVAKNSVANVRPRLLRLGAIEPEGV